MSSVGTMHAFSPPSRRAGTTRQVLLACGILSLLAYAAADILGGLVYEGYSFTSQAVSELMARGAPSERFVDPLFLAYNAFMLAFAIGVYREGTSKRPLRLAGLLLAIYACAGFSGPILFEMDQRGSGSLQGDLPHILLTGVLALLLILSIGIGGFAFDRRFRAYSFATLLTVIGCGALTTPFAARLAAGEPTPGFGIIERITIYASLLWIALLGARLLRHRGPVYDDHIVGAR